MILINARLINLENNPKYAFKKSFTVLRECSFSFNTTNTLGKLDAAVLPTILHYLIKRS